MRKPKPKKPRCKSTVGQKKQDAIFIAGEIQQRTLEKFHRDGFRRLTSRDRAILLRLIKLGCDVILEESPSDVEETLYILFREIEYPLFDGREYILRFRPMDESSLDLFATDGKFVNALHVAKLANTASITKFVR